MSDIPDKSEVLLKIIGKLEELKELIYEEMESDLTKKEKGKQ